MGAGLTGKLLLGAALFMSTIVGHAEDLETVRGLLFRGEYSEAVRKAEVEMNRNRDEAPWAEIIAEALRAQGKYQEAAQNARNWARWDRRGLRTRWLAFESARSIGDEDTAQMMLFEMNDLVRRRGGRYQDSEEMVVIGRMALELGADPKLVVKNFFEPVSRDNPETRMLYLAAGGLALQKNDFQLASKWFTDGNKRFPEDPAMCYGLARSFSSSDAEETSKWINRALELNPRHKESKLLLVDMLLNSESFDEARELLDEVQELSPQEPEMWAYRAVIRHLENDAEGEIEARRKALELNPVNPRVPYLIGKKLSQQYRFREGSSYQRMALAMKEDYLPSQIQLAQDLLRLGRNDEGWELASKVHEKDGYDVTAFNLVTLRDNLRDYTVVTNENFIIRVDAAEAEIIGRQALELLQEAYDRLTVKYNFYPPEPTTVEIFSSTADFEVRTFGMPNIPGYLGVCFGPVITANSPSTPRMQSVNWQSVLWHEFCHTVTLGATRNRMPRWLSEGLSVHEETLRNPAWGMQLNPQFLQWIAEGDLLPISDLTSAFMNPKTPGHIEFAYYQSAKVVEFLLELHPEERIADLLADLSRGMDINAALEKNYQSMKSLDSGFEKWIKASVADATGELKFTRSRPSSLLSQGLPGNVPAPLVEDVSNNFWTLMKEAEDLLESGDFEGAESIALEILEDYPEPRRTPNPFAVLSAVYRQQEDTGREIEILERWADIEVGPRSLYERLIELHRQEENWDRAIQFARDLIAIDPFNPELYALQAEYATREEKSTEAISNWELVLQLDPDNPAEVYFDLFRLRRELDRDRAYQDLLSTLELAPRHRAALSAFLEWQKPEARGEELSPYSDRDNPAGSRGSQQSKPPAETAL